MPIGTSTGEAYEDHFNFLLNNPIKPESEESPVTSTTSPKAKAGETVPPQNLDVQGQVKDALTTLLPSALRGLTPEEHLAIARQRQDTTEPGKIPEDKSLMEMNPLAAGMMGGLDIASNLVGPETGAVKESLFLGLGGMKNLLGKDLFTKTTGLASDLAEKIIPLVRDGKLNTEQAAEIVRGQTGVSFGADELPRYEIPDIFSNIKASKLPLNEPRKAFAVNLPDILNHPELYKAYPEIAKMKIINVSDEDVKNNIYGRMTESYLGTPLLQLNIDRPISELKSTILHEIQHWIQKREGFAKGGAPEIQIDPTKPVSDEQYRRYTAAYDKYEALAGETEARNVQARRSYSREQLREVPPTNTEDLPRSAQTVIK